MGHPSAPRQHAKLIKFKFKSKWRTKPANNRKETIAESIKLTYRRVDEVEHQLWP